MDLIYTSLFSIAVIIQAFLSAIGLYFASKRKAILWQIIFVALLIFVVFKTYWESWNWFIPYILPVAYIIFALVKKKTNPTTKKA